MVMKYGWLIIAVGMVQNMSAMNKSGEFLKDQFLRRVDPNEIDKLIGKKVKYKEVECREGFLGEKVNDGWYRVYFDEKDKSKSTIRSAEELYYSENTK